MNGGDSILNSSIVLSRDAWHSGTGLIYWDLEICHDFCSKVEDISFLS